MAPVVAAGAPAASAAYIDAVAATGSSSMHRPQALVYRGPATGPGLAEAVADLLKTSPRKFHVRFAGPNETIKLTKESFTGVDVFAQPGGPDVEEAWDQLKDDAAAVRDFVSGGGRYLGFCLGAYLADSTPGYGIIPRKAQVDSEIDQDGAQVKTDEDTIIQIDWTFTSGRQAGQTVRNRWIYFQEGAVMQGFKDTKNNNTRILARYSKNGDIAATLNKFGSGWVGLIGPHPEASQDWFDDYDIDSSDGLQYDIGYDFIEAVMLDGRTEKASANGDARSGVSKVQSPSRRLVGSEN